MKAVVSNGILHIRSRDNYGESCTFLTYYKTDNNWIFSPLCCLSFDLTHPNIHPMEMCHGCDYVLGLELAFNTLLCEIKKDR